MITKVLFCTLLFQVKFFIYLYLYYLFLMLFFHYKVKGHSSLLTIFLIASFLIINFTFSIRVCRYKNVPNSFVGHNRLYCGQGENSDSSSLDKEISQERKQQFQFSDDDNINDLSDEEKEQILSLLEREGPSELEKRLRMMGFTPFTYAGFALAAVILSLNTLLGTGWLGDLLGMNEDTTASITSTGEEQPLFQIIEDQNLRFDYDKLREFQAEQSKR